MLEFSGERVVPGLVDENLFNEHLARYRFASSFLSGKAGLRVLDAGCGSGYGTAQFGGEAGVIGIDVAAEAVIHARQTYGCAGRCFVQASCDAIPFADASFDLVVAFEVIEHLDRWQEMLSESRRVLKPAGILLVSTPNKGYYAQSRGEAGPNPYHVHEFEYEEFRAALKDVFACAQLWSQNHAEGIAFVPANPTAGFFDAAGDPEPSTAHFYFAACSASPLPEAKAFAWLPGTGNVLRERERHIALLEEEVRQKTAWLEEQTERHAELKEAHDSLLVELRQQNEWGEALNADIAKARQRIASLEEETRIRLEWVQGLEKQIANGAAEISRLNSELDQTQRDFRVRSEWGEAKAEEARQAVEIINRLYSEVDQLKTQVGQLKAQNEILEGQKRTLEATRWVRAGRKLSVIP